MRVNIIGMGRWGPNLVRAFMSVPGVTVGRVADPDQSALDRVTASIGGGLQGTQDVALALRDPEATAVAIATPVVTHYELTKAALEAGKHVLVEKPFCRTSAQCAELIELAREKDLRLMVGHVFLFNPSILRFKELLDSGSLGKVFYLEAHRTNLGPVREDVNAIWDLTSHDISIFSFLLGSQPESVSATASRTLEGMREDTAFTTLRYPGGVLAHAHASWLNPLKVRTITAVGSQRTIIWDDIHLNRPLQVHDIAITLDDYTYSDSFSSHRLSYRRGDVSIPYIELKQPLLEQCRHFAEAVANGETPRSDGVFGAQVVRVLEATDASLAEHSRFQAL